MTTLLLALLLAQAADKQAEEAAVEAVKTCEQVFSKNQDVNARTQALYAMARTQHEKVLAKLLVYLSDKDKGVKLAAVQATLGFQGAAPELKRIANKNLLRSLESGINLKDVDFRVAVTNALGAMGEEASVATVKTLLDDKSLRVSMAAINASVAMRQKPLLEELIRQQRECEKTMKASSNVQFKGRKPTSSRKDPDAPPDPEDVKVERAATLVTLIPPAVKELTGQDLKTGAEMEIWWSKNRSSFAFLPK